MKKLVGNLFSYDEINSGRQLEMDIAKGIWILGMIMVHLIEMFNSVEYTGVIGAIVFILSGPLGAPVFMMCMGVGLCYTKNSKPESIMKRGLWIVALAIILNLLRSTIPDLILWLFTGDIVLLEEISYIFEIDIMIFAGLALFSIGLMQKIGLSSFKILLVSVLLSVIGTVLKGINSGMFALDILISYFWGIKIAGTANFDETVWFPLFYWLIFPSAGLWLGSYLKRCTDKHKLYKTLSLPCFMLGVGYIALGFFLGFGPAFSPDGIESMRNYYFMNCIDAFFCILSGIGVIGAFYSISVIFKNCSFSFLKELSRNINEIYCIHWIIIGFMAMVFDILDINDKITGLVQLILWISISFVSILLARLLRAKLNNKSISHI